MMMKLGKKIKQLRNEKGLSQANLSPNGGNNSLISHIENGTTKNPNKHTLMLIAKELDISFDELIKDTDYQPDTFVSRDYGFAISQCDFNVEVVDIDGNFKIKRRIYPRYDEIGKENIFCPKTGTPLLTMCNNCKKHIDNPYSIYCMGCGNKIFFDFSKKLFDDGFDNHFKKLLAKKEYRTELFILKYLWFNDDFLEDDGDMFDMKGDTFDDSEIEYLIKDIFNNPKNPKSYISGSDMWTPEEFRKGISSSTPEIVQVFVNWLAIKIFAKKYIEALNKFYPNTTKEATNE